MCACAWCAHISSCDLFNASPQIFKKTQYTKTPQVRIHIVDFFFLKKIAWWGKEYAWNNAKDKHLTNDERNKNALPRGKKRKEKY